MCAFMDNHHLGDWTQGWVDACSSVAILIWNDRLCFSGRFIFIALQGCQETFPAAIYCVCVPAQNTYAFMYMVINSRTAITAQEREQGSVVGISLETPVECLVAVRNSK